MDCRLCRSVRKEIGKKVWLERRATGGQTFTKISLLRSLEDV